MKRVLSLVLAISMVMSMFTFSFAGTSLKDVTGTDYQSAVEALVELGIVNGYEDGTYRPEQTVSRAEMAKLLVIAAGLEAAAELNEGATRFADVNGGWASGYINVAAEYGYIMGDPDGNFRPDDTVSYAEAVTMALRVLGYKSVVEAKGTWPTNYIAKAEDLEMLEDITYTNYAEGAKRGNCAILIWNMLRERMWAVNGESEGDGLQYGKGEPMLNVKFPDYAYSNAEFVDFRVNGDGEIEVTLDDNYDSKNPGSLDQSTYVYAGNDFYKFVAGTEVEVLVNEEDETLLTMVRTGRDSFDEGLKSEIDDKYDSISGDEYDYVYAMIEKKDAVESTQLTIDSEYIYKTEVKDKYIRLNKTKRDFEDYDDVEVILAGEGRTEIKSVEVDDVLSKVTVDGVDFYVVSNETVTGKLTRYTRTEALEDGSTYALIVVDGTEYVVDPNATYVIDREDTKEFEKGNKLASISSASTLSDMEDEEVKVYLDFAGRVARVEFDGELEDEEDSNYAFYATANGMDYESKQYITHGENEADDRDLVFAKDSSIVVAEDEVTPSQVFFGEPAMLDGVFGWLELDEDDEVLSYVAIARGTSGETADEIYEDGVLYTSDDVLPADEDDSNKYYEIIVPEVLVSYDAKTTSLRDADDETDEIADIDSDVVVVTLGYDNNGTNKEKDDFRTVEFAEGLDALADLEDELVVLVVYTDDTEGTSDVLYVVRFAENKSVENDLAAKLTKLGDNLLDGYYPFYVNGEHDVDDVLRGPAASGDEIAELLGGVIVYSTELNRNDKLIAEIRSGLTVDSILGAFDAAIEEELDVIKEVANGKVQFSGDPNKYTMIELTDSDYVGVFEDHMFVVVDIKADAEKAEDVVEAVEVIDEEDIAVDIFAADDVLVVHSDEDIVYILRGFDFDVLEDEEDDDNDNDNEDDEPVVEAAKVTITWDAAGVILKTDAVKGSTLTGLEDADFEAADKTLPGVTITGWVRLDENGEPKEDTFVPVYADTTYTATVEEVEPEQEPAGN